MPRSRPRPDSSQVEKRAEVSWWKEQDGKRKEKRGHFGVPLTFDSPTANLNVSLRGKVNLGNYESADFGVSLTLPCKNTPRAIELGFRTARAFVEEKMSELHAEVRGE